MGVGLFQFGAGVAFFRDTSEIFPHEIEYPSNLTDLRRSIFRTSPNDKLHNIDLVLGYANGKETFVVDENNNRNLADDPQILLDRMSWYDDEGTIKVEYKYVDIYGEERTDSSWIKVGLSNGEVYYARYQNLIESPTKEQMKSNLDLSNLFHSFRWSSKLSPYRLQIVLYNCTEKILRTI